MSLRGIWQECSAGRATTWALAVVCLFVIIQLIFVLPYFECVAGFKPFDTQSPLSAAAVAIQLGAYRAGAASAYSVFLASELPLALSVSAFFALLWRWMFLVSPNRIFAFLKNGGILLTPFIAVFFNFAESVGFARLINGLSGPAYASAIEFSTLMHQLRTASEDVRIYLTIFFAGIIATQWIRKKEEGL